MLGAFGHRIEGRWPGCPVLVVLWSPCGRPVVTLSSPSRHPVVARAVDEWLQIGKTRKTVYLADLAVVIA